MIKSEPIRHHCYANSGKAQGTPRRDAIPNRHWHLRRGNSGANIHLRPRLDYKPLVKIGQELGVDAVVEGTVARSGDRVRVNGRLFSTGDDRNLLAQSFERDAGDILSLEDDLAQSVSRRIEVVLTPESMRRRDEPHAVNVQPCESGFAGQEAGGRACFGRGRGPAQPVDGLLRIEPVFDELCSRADFADRVRQANIPELPKAVGEK